MVAYIFAPHEFALPHTEESAVGILESQAGLKGMEGFFHTDVDLLGSGQIRPAVSCEKIRDIMRGGFEKDGVLRRVHVA